MLPRDLKLEDFSAYPPESRNLVAQHLAALRQLPVSFLPSLLREVIEYDFKFPAERVAIEKELANLSSLSPEDLEKWFYSFAQIHLSPKLEEFDWVNDPARFVEQLAAHLWSTHQQDAFRQAALTYADRLRAVAPPQPPPVPRLGIAIIGQGVSAYEKPLFRKLRPHGAYFPRVNPENALAQLLLIVSGRAKANPAPYGHWYVDGGAAVNHDPSVTYVSYAALAPPRAVLYHKLEKAIERPGMGPEALRTMLSEMRCQELGLDSGDPVFDRFQLKLLTEGSGTQIFSTTFAQWAAREALRRAQPLTLLVRFAPRQRQRPMNELLSGKGDSEELDPIGSLIDADMGAYYNWINQQRLPGAEQSSFIAWFEGHGEALAISPSLPRGTVSNSPCEMKQVLSWAS